MKDDLVAARVIARERPASDVVSLRLASGTTGVPLPAFEAGAHIDVHLRDGLSRKYSLCSDPGERGFYEIAVKREERSRGGSAYVHEAIDVGDIIQIGQPKNYFPLEPGDGPAVLVAAGIGVTPLLAMAHSLKRTGRAFEFHYFARSLDSAAYSAQLCTRFAGHSRVYLGLTPAATAERLTRVIGEMHASAHLYFCGPSGFMSALEAIAVQHLPARNIHSESFSGPLIPGTRGNRDREFVIELARSRRVLTVPADRSITDVLYDHGIAVPTSCEAGLCGACRSTVMAGVPDHRDTFLSAEEKVRNDSIMLCVSRCMGERLVLDI